MTALKDACGGSFARGDASCAGLLKMMLRPGFVPNDSRVKDTRIKPLQSRFKTYTCRSAASFARDGRFGEFSSRPFRPGSSLKGEENEMTDVVKIDGSMGEGGGQVLRTALSLGATAGKAVELVKIRAGREKPGLKRQHLTCVKAVAEICGADVSAVEVGSGDLSFRPGPIRAGEYRFDIGTAGSVTLVAQTVLPVLLKANGPSVVTITGGTHVPHAPTWEFFADVYLPELRLMSAEVEAEMESFGFYPGAGGAVRLKIKPFDEANRVAHYGLSDLGAYRGGRVVGVVSSLPRAIAEAEVGIVAERLADLNLTREVQEVASFGPGNCCHVRLEYDRATVIVSSVGTHDKSRKSVANEVVESVAQFVTSGKACERHLADQLLVPMRILLGAGADCDIAIERETKHYTTNKAVIGLFEGSRG